MPRTLQIITDITDASYNEMYAIIHSISERLSETPINIAPFTPVKEYSITHGAFLTRLMAKNYINPVVLYTNVSPHPTHNTDVIGRTKKKNIIFIGANTGVFDWLVKDYGLAELVQITKRKPFIVDGEFIYLPGETPPKNFERRFSNKTEHLTFAAHTILGSIASAVTIGMDLRLFGEERDQIFIVKHKIKNGEIVHIDNFGNAKIYGTISATEGQRLLVLKDGKKIAQGVYIAGRMMSQPTGIYAIYPSTSLTNMVDMALIRGDACKSLKLNIGDVLSFKLC